MPAFLMLSALLLTRSLLQDASLGRYFRHRAQSIFWPTFLWSLLCVFYARYNNHNIAWHEAARQVWTGQADYHIYFLRVLSQLCVLMPFLLPLMHCRPPLWWILVGSTALTLVVFGANRFYFGFANVASWIFWYIPSVALGLYLGTHSDKWPVIAQRGLMWTFFLTLAGAALYLPLALRNLAGEDIRAATYPLSWWLFVSTTGFLLFCMIYQLCARWPDSWILQFWRYLGRYSLQIYLLHPLILGIFERNQWFIGNSMTFLPLCFCFLWRLVLCLSVPLIFAWIFENVRPSVLLFGR